MAETYRYTLQKPARLLYSSVTEKSAPRTVRDAVAKFSATVGVDEIDFKAMVELMVTAIKSETGNFTSPADYFLACQSGKTAGKRAIQKAEFDCNDPKLSADEKFKIMEKAEKRAELYAPYAGILTASSQYDVSLARLEGGKIIDIGEEAHVRAAAGKDLFYPGAYVVPMVAFKGFRRKTLEAKDGCTSYLQNMLFIRKGERIAGAGGPSNNEVFGSFAGYSDVDPLANAPSSSTGAVEEAEAF